MSDTLTLYDFCWTELTPELLRRFIGITGRACDPGEKVVARAIGYDISQVFIVKDCWNMHNDLYNRLGWMIAGSSGHRDLKDAYNEARATYTKVKRESGEWPISGDRARQLMAADNPGERDAEHESDYWRER